MQNRTNEATQTQNLPKSPNPDYSNIRHYYLNNYVLPYKPYLKMPAQTFFTTGFITAGCYGFDLFTLSQMTKTSFAKVDLGFNGGFKMSPSSLRTVMYSLLPFMGALPKNFAHALTKTSIYSNKGYVEKQFQGSHEQVAHESSVSEPQQNANLSVKQKIKQGVPAAATLGGAELAATQYIAVLKTIAALNAIEAKSNENTSKPHKKMFRSSFPTMHDKYNLGRSVGFTTRSIGIGSGAFFFVVGQNVLADQFEAYLPKEKFGSTGKILATTGSAMAAGLTGHVTSNIFNNIVDKATITPEGGNPCRLRTFNQPLPAKYKINAPGFIEMGRYLLRSRGVSSFKAGLWPAVGSTIVAYGCYGIGEKFTNWLFGDLPTQQETFNRQAATIAQTPEPSVASVAPQQKLAQEPKDSINAMNTAAKQGHRNNSVFAPKQPNAPTAIQEDLNKQAIPNNRPK